jgi:hypothetical protein
MFKAKKKSKNMEKSKEFKSQLRKQSVICERMHRRSSVRLLHSECLQNFNASRDRQTDGWMDRQTDKYMGKTKSPTDLWNARLVNLLVLKRKGFILTNTNLHTPPLCPPPRHRPLAKKQESLPHLAHIPSGPYR